MKLHRPVAEHVISALKSTFGLVLSSNDDGRAYYADKVLERIFKNNRQLGGRDRRLVAEATYEIVRWWRLLAFAVDADENNISLEDLWRIFGAWLVLNDHSSLPEWPEFEGIDRTKVQRRMKKPPTPAVGESLPEWIYEMGLSELGERWASVAKALNEPAPLTIRTNRLKTDREQLKARLQKEIAAASPNAGEIVIHDLPDSEDGLFLPERRNLFATEAFKDGWFELQDGSSQTAALVLAPKPGERVIDACAGAGGKTLHLAAMMKNKGKIYSLDVVEKKLEELKRRCRRAGVDISEARLIEGKALKRLTGCADAILLDVPCSGLGVVRRNPDTKWKLRREELDRLRDIQAEIISTYGAMAKPKGRMVYATCSILPSENGDQVRKFLASEAGAHWKLVNEHQCWPRPNAPASPSGDGFYTALLQRDS